MRTRSWTFPFDIKINLELEPQHVRLAPLFQAMHQRGATVNVITMAYKKDWAYVRAVLTFAETGVSTYDPLKRRNNTSTAEDGQNKAGKEEGSSQ